MCVCVGVRRAEERHFTGFTSASSQAPRLPRPLHRAVVSSRATANALPSSRARIQLLPGSCRGLFNRRARESTLHSADDAVRMERTVVRRPAYHLQRHAGNGVNGDDGHDTQQQRYGQRQHDDDDNQKPLASVLFCC